MLLSSGSGKKLNGMKKGTNKMEILFFAFIVLALVRKISDLVWERNDLIYFKNQKQLSPRDFSKLMDLAESLKTKY